MPEQRASATRQIAPLILAGVLEIGLIVHLWFSWEESGAILRFIIASWVVNALALQFLFQSGITPARRVRGRRTR